MPNKSTKSSKTRYSKNDIRKYDDGYWITAWMEYRGCRVKITGPYSHKDFAITDIEVLNAKQSH